MTLLKDSPLSPTYIVGTIQFNDKVRVPKGLCKGKTFRGLGQENNRNNGEVPIMIEKRCVCPSVCEKQRKKERYRFKM